MRQPHPALICRYRLQPRCKVLGLIQLIDRLERFDESVLRDVLRIRIIDYLMVSQTVYQSLVFPNQLPKSIPVASPGELHQFGI